MNTRYHSQKVGVMIDIQSDLYKRICEAAEKEGKSIEDFIELITQVNLISHWQTNVRIFEE